MSPLEVAFEELLDAQEEARGKRVKCKIASKEYDFLAGNEALTPEFIGGGDADSGSITGHVRASDFPNGIPKFTPFEYDGERIVILDTTTINDTIEISAGEPAADE